jgi:esterase/lipase
MATITHKGVKLAYEDRGAGKPPFVFIHGWTCNRSFFAPQAEHFERQHRVVSLDLRGHGESDKPQGAYPISAYVDDIAFVIGELGLAKVVAVGHSMGGITVLELGAAHPDKVAAIEAGNNEPRRQFITNNLFMPTSDKGLVDRVLQVMMASPSHVAAAAMKGILGFDGPGAASRCKVPALHLAAQPPLNPPHLMSQWLPTAVNGLTVARGTST